jgi:four helix bundle protein
VERPKVEGPKVERPKVERPKVERHNLKRQNLKRQHKSRVGSQRPLRFLRRFGARRSKTACFRVERRLHSVAVMNQWRERMKLRTHEFAVAVIVFVNTLPDGTQTDRLKDQLIGAAWGVNGNWYAACRARTHKEFTAKLGVVLEEADEAAECLDVIHDAELSQTTELERLRRESKELRAIFAKATRTASDNEKRRNQIEKRRLRR